MRFSTSAILAILASPLALAQSNPFNVPAGLSATAGQTLNLTWKPTTSGTVSLVLRSGASSNLQEGTVIASNIDNSGKYSWSVPSSITRGSDYTVEIVSDSDNTATNYTPYFVIDSTNTVASSTGLVSMGAPSSTISASTASNTNTASSTSASGSSTGTATVTTTMTGSMTGSMTSSASGSATNSGSSSSSGMSTRTGSSSSSGAGFQTSTSASASASASAQSANAAPMATAAAGLMGLVALGAMAL